jgi:hypothetical protein
MVAQLKPQDLSVTLKFGGGLHTRASTDEIDPREAADGSNFLLDIENRELRNRPPFDLVGTLPNAGAVLGGGSLLKADGTVSTLFQGAGKVYSWDGSTGFTQVGACNASSKLRGHWASHNWTLSDKVLFTDLTLNDVIKEWDGTTFQSTTFTDECGASFGSLSARYLSVTDERALFAYIKDSSSTFPHLMAGSAQSVYTQITTTNRPSSALSTGDPFFMVTPDLKPINGMVGAFGVHIVSTEKGKLFDLEGTSSKDFTFNDFYAGSAASGMESLAYIGNDIIFGRQGRIESVRDTQSFGNSEADDLSSEIADRIQNYTGWTTAFNSRLNRVYMFPAGVSECWVFNSAFRTARQLSANAQNQFVFQTAVQKEAGSLSPWMRWTTSHALAFQPTFVMPMLDPTDGLEYVFMGDSSGNIYRLEGDGAAGDGGISDVDVSWTSKLFSAPLDAEVYTVEGFIKYRKDVAATVTITLLAAGRTAFDNSITVDIPAVTGVNYWGDSTYWSGDFYWGAAFQDRLVRQTIGFPGQCSDFQIRVSVSGTTDFHINQILLRFKAASQ